jgi:hypothetical protein
VTAAMVLIAVVGQGSAAMSLVANPLVEAVVSSIVSLLAATSVHPTTGAVATPMLCRMQWITP